MINNQYLKNDFDYTIKKFEKISLFNDKTILITGFAGFLGFYITNLFLYAMEEKLVNFKSLILCDNFLIRKPLWVKEIERTSDKIHVKQFDISKDDIETIEIAEQADYIIHMASIASPTYYRQYPLQTIDANVGGLRNLLEYYHNKKVKGFLFFSSSEIYGDPHPSFIPTKESYLGNVSCIGPRSCYDEAKRFGETLCYYYADIYKMPITIVRPFNNYGPGMQLNDKRLPADFANNVLGDKDIIIYSDGTPTRTFCYIADAVNGYLRALTHHSFNYFNIGTEKPEISVVELANIYQKHAKSMWNYDGDVHYEKPEDKNYLTHNPARRCPDISKAKELLGYNPEINVREGVKRFLQYLLKERGMG